MQEKMFLIECENANWVNNISNHILMKQYSQNCSAAMGSVQYIKAEKCLILIFPVEIQVTMEFHFEFQLAINAERTYFLHPLPFYNSNLKIRNKKVNKKKTVQFHE